MEIVFKGACIVFSYLLGACPNAYVIGKLVKGIDIREHGSGNVGATNVFRVIGRRWGLCAFLLDVVKGVLAVTLWNYIAPFFGVDSVSLRFLFACGIVSVMGHNWTVFLRFKGGKGVATTLGILLGLFPVPVVIAVVCAFAIIFITHYVSVGSICGAIIFPITFAIFNRDMQDFPFFMGVICFVAAMLILKHKANIKRLLKGEENKIY